MIFVLDYIPRQIQWQDFFGGAILGVIMGPDPIIQVNMSRTLCVCFLLPGSYGLAIG